MASCSAVAGYRQFCGVAKALDILGERWTLLIVRDLILGPRRFSDIARNLPGLTPNVLAKRLAHLKEHGLIEAQPLPARPSTSAYALTEVGRSLEPVILSLGAFGARYLNAPPGEDRLDPRYAMLSLKRRYAGSPVSGTVALKIGGDGFTAGFGGPKLHVADGLPAHADVQLTAKLAAWFPLLSRQVTLAELERRGEVVRAGSRRVAAAFVRCIGARA